MTGIGISSNEQTAFHISICISETITIVEMVVVKQVNTHLSVE